MKKEDLLKHKTTTITTTKKPFKKNKGNMLGFDYLLGNMLIVGSYMKLVVLRILELVGPLQVLIANH